MHPHTLHDAPTSLTRPSSVLGFPRRGSQRYGASRVLQRFYRNIVNLKCTVNVLNVAKNVLRTQRDDKVGVDTKPDT